MAGIDLGTAWADEVWEAGVWADGVWEGQEAAGGGATVVACSSATGTLHDEFEQLSDGSALDVGNGSVEALSQSFVSSGDAETATGVCLRLRKIGTPTGTFKAAIYAHSGTYGTSSVPTGAALVESVDFDVSTLTTSFADYFFALSGWDWDASTNYTVVCDASGVSGDASNKIEATIEQAGDATHGGNLASKASGGSWTAQSSDLPFKVYYGGDTPGQAGELSALSRATKQHGVLSSMILRGVRTILFFLIGAQ